MLTKKPDCYFLCRCLFLASFSLSNGVILANGTEQLEPVVQSGSSNNIGPVSGTQKFIVPETGEVISISFDFDSVSRKFTTIRVVAPFVDTAIPSEILERFANPDFLFVLSYLVREPPANPSVCFLTLELTFYSFVSDDDDELVTDLSIRVGKDGVSGVLIEHPDGQSEEIAYESAPEEFALCL